MATPQVIDIDGQVVSVADVMVCPVTGVFLVAPDKAGSYQGIQRVVASKKQIREGSPGKRIFDIYVHSRSTTQLIG